MSNSPFNPLISDSAKQVLRGAVANSLRDKLEREIRPERILEDPAPAPEAAKENDLEQPEIPPPAAHSPPANWL